MRPAPPCLHGSLRSSGASHPCASPSLLSRFRLRLPFCFHHRRRRAGKRQPQAAGTAQGRTQVRPSHGPWPKGRHQRGSLYYLSRLRRGTAGTPRLPPGPRSLPLVGNLLDLHGALHHMLARLAPSRDAAREAFTRHDRCLATRAVPDAARPRGVLRALHDLAPELQPEVEGPARRRGHARLLPARRPRAQGAGSGAVAVPPRPRGTGDAVYRGVLNLVSGAFFSIDVVDVGAESAQRLRELVEAIVEAISKPNISDVFPFLRPLDLQGWRRRTSRHYEEIFRFLDVIIDRRLAEASSSGHTHGDFLDALLDPKSVAPPLFVSLLLLDERPYSVR